MKREGGTDGRTISRGVPPKHVLVKGHIPFLVLCDGHEEDEDEEDETDEGVVGKEVKQEKGHIRKKRYIEISVDRNSFPNHILPSFASENTFETNMGGEAQEIREKFSPGEAGEAVGAGETGEAGEAGGVMRSRNVAEEENVGSLEGENEILPYPRFVSNKILPHLSF